LFPNLLSLGTGCKEFVRSVVHIVERSQLLCQVQVKFVESPLSTIAFFDTTPGLSVKFNLVSSFHAFSYNGEYLHLISLQ
jgi:hypothetical protein